MDIKAYIKEVGGAELARQIGCSRGLVSHWMTGRSTPSIDWAIKIEVNAGKRGHRLPDGGEIKRQDVCPSPFEGMVI